MIGVQGDGVVCLVKNARIEDGVKDGSWSKGLAPVACLVLPDGDAGSLQYYLKLRKEQCKLLKELCLDHEIVAWYRAVD